MTRTSAAGHLRLIGALASLSLSLGACTLTSTEVVTATVPDDYKHRHPIALQEANQSIAVFVGQGRGGLTSQQRADIAGLAQARQRAGTGAIIASVPVDTPNARAAADAYREIRAVLAAGGVPSRAITMRRYRFVFLFQLAVFCVGFFCF